MAGGPRKFSEKIALLNQKEAEANAAFNSIMGEVARVRTNNSGSQSDMNQPNESSTQKINRIEESMNFNEHISVTYDNQQQNSNFSNQYKVKKYDDNKKDNLQTQNSFLQLPNHTDPFRRALSDSSINQTVSSVPSPNSFNSNNFQLSYNQNYQQNDSQVYQNYQNVNFQLSFNEYDNQQSATNMNQMANGPQHKIFKNEAASVQSGPRTLSTPNYNQASYNQADFDFNSSPYFQANNSLKPDSFLSPNSNTLNPQNSNGGSLPDLTAFQLQNNQFHQNLQLNNYNQQQKNTYQLQLLQPSIQQHSHIGPVKPTHLGSVSPTRGTARYSPTNSNQNRRPSPQRSMPSRINTQSKSSSLSAHSTPTSPLHSNQPLPVLEFTINSSQVNNYGKNSMNNGMYRNVTGNVCPNGGESLPPSPQSQQSCFNSPQGSPDPLSISPQDMNPFTSGNNYEMIQKKFDCINLDSSNNQLNFGQFLMHSSNQMVKKSRNENIADTIENDIGAINQSMVNSGNENMNTCIISSNQVNNLQMFNDIEVYQQNMSFKTNLLNKNHKNSIPNIILTSPEEKGNVVLSQELSSDLNFDVTNLIDFSNFSGPVSIDDVNTINFNETI